MEEKPPFIESVYQYWLNISVIVGVAVGVAVQFFAVSGDLAFYTLPISGPAVIIAVTLSGMRVKRGGVRATPAEYVIPGIVSLLAFYLFFTAA